MFFNETSKKVGRTAAIITDKKEFLINCLPFFIKLYIMENDI